MVNLQYYDCKYLQQWEVGIYFRNFSGKFNVIVLDYCLLFYTLVHVLITDKHVVNLIIWTFID